MKPDVAIAIHGKEVDRTLSPRPPLVPENGSGVGNGVKAFCLEETAKVGNRPVHEGLEGAPIHHVTGGHRRGVGGIVDDRLQVTLLKIEAGDQDEREEAERPESDSVTSQLLWQSTAVRVGEPSIRVHASRDSDLHKNVITDFPASKGHVSRMKVDSTTGSEGCDVEGAGLPVSLTPEQTGGIGQLVLVDALSQDVVLGLQRKGLQVFGGRVCRHLVGVDAGGRGLRYPFRAEAALFGLRYGGAHFGKETGQK